MSFPIFSKTFGIRRDSFELKKRWMGGFELKEKWMDNFELKKIVYHFMKVILTFLFITVQS